MANFITIDINSILNKNSTIPKDRVEKQTGTSEMPATQKKPTNRIDWSKELKKRLDDNRALDPEARVSDYEIEAQFWSDFFNATWPEDIAEILDKVNEILRTDEYKSFSLAYVLKVKDECQNCYAVAMDGDRIIGFNPFDV